MAIDATHEELLSLTEAVTAIGRWRISEVRGL